MLFRGHCSVTAGSAALSPARHPLEFHTHLFRPYISFIFFHLVCFSILISCLSAGTRAKALCFRVYLYLTSRSATSARSLGGRKRVSAVMNHLARGNRRAAPLNWDFWTNLCSVFELQSNKWTVEGVCNGD